MCRSPRTRSPADRFSASWLMPRSAAHLGSGAVGDEQSILVDGGFQHRLDGFSRHLRQHRAERGAATVRRHQDRHLFARQAALGRLSTTLAGLTIELSITLATVKKVGFVGFDDAAQRCGRGLERPQEAVTPPKRRTHGDVAAPGRRPDRIALFQRLGEIEPALLMAQPGQGRSGQSIEALAAGFAAVPPQAVGAPSLDPASGTAMRTAPLGRDAILDRRRHLLARFPPVQDLLHLLTLFRRQIIHPRQPRAKRADVHRILPIYGDNSTDGGACLANGNCAIIKVRTSACAGCRGDLVASRSGPPDPWSGTPSTAGTPDDARASATAPPPRSSIVFDPDPAALRAASAPRRSSAKPSPLTPPEIPGEVSSLIGRGVIF